MCSSQLPTLRVAQSPFVPTENVTLQEQGNEYISTSFLFKSLFVLLKHPGTFLGECCLNWCVKSISGGLFEAADLYTFGALVSIFSSFE